LTWTASTDTYSGMQGYIVYRNSVAIANTTTPSYTNTTARKGTSCTYTVAAKDKVGNVSAQSSSKTVTAK